MKCVALQIRIHVIMCAFLSILYISSSAGERAVVGAITGLMAAVLVGIITRISRKKIVKKEIRLHKSVDTEMQTEARKPFFSSETGAGSSTTLNQNNPEKQGVKKKIEETSAAKIAIKPLRMKDVSYEQQLLALLRKACFPKNFMEPYDFEKINVANDIYSKLQADNLSSQDVYSLRDRAVKELGIKIDASFLFEELSSVCNPENFMDPYDAEKVNTANELYHRVLENKDDILALEDIMKEVNVSSVFNPHAPNKEIVAEISSAGETETELIAKSGRLLNYWEREGNIIRMTYDDTSNLAFLELKAGDSWARRNTLLPIQDLKFKQGGFGAMFKDVDDSGVTYKINRWNGELQVIYHGLVSERWRMLSNSFGGIE